MAKPIIVTLDGVESSFELSKIERSRLYGARRRQALDQDGRPCVKASLTTDGLYLLQSGMTSQGYFDETGRWLQKSQLVGLDADGQPLEIKPSTLGVAQTINAVDPAEMLRHTTDAVYQLDAATVDGALATRLEAGDVFKFGFNYGADYHLETAFLVKNAEGYFCLVGTSITPAWCEPGKVTVIDSAEESADDLDFEMF